MNQKVVYPIAKKYVIGATRITNASYDKIIEMMSVPQLHTYNLGLWTLTTDDYLVEAKRDGSALDTNNDDGEFICFICY